MSKNKDNNETVKYEELEIGKAYIVSLTSGAVISGVLLSKREDLQNGNVVKEIGLMFDSATQVYLCDCQIAKMREIPADDIEDYFKKFQRIYGIKCFNKEGELLSASKILRNLIYMDNTWSKLTKRKRRELIQYLHFSNEDIWDMIEAFLEQRKENQRLQKYQLNALEAALKLSKNCQSLKNIKTYDRNMLNDVFEKIELEKLIDQIC